jgi:hypothetical protein
MPSPRSSLNASVVPLNLNFEIVLTPMPNGPTMREIVIDTGTTGLDPLNGDRVVEIEYTRLLGITQSSACSLKSESEQRDHDK